MNDKDRALLLRRIHQFLWLPIDPDASRALADEMLAAFPFVDEYWVGDNEYNEALSTFKVEVFEMEQRKEAEAFEAAYGHLRSMEFEAGLTDYYRCRSEYELLADRQSLKEQLHSCFVGGLQEIAAQTTLWVVEREIWLRFLGSNDIGDLVSDEEYADLLEDFEMIGHYDEDESEEDNL